MSHHVYIPQFNYCQSKFIYFNFDLVKQFIQVIELSILNNSKSLMSPMSLTGPMSPMSLKTPMSPKRLMGQWICRSFVKTNQAKSVPLDMLVYLSKSSNICLLNKEIKSMKWGFISVYAIFLKTHHFLVEMVSTYWKSHHSKNLCSCFRKLYNCWCGIFLAWHRVAFWKMHCKKAVCDHNWWP